MRKRRNKSNHFEPWLAEMIADSSSAVRPLSDGLGKFVNSVPCLLTCPDVDWKPTCWKKNPNKQTNNKQTPQHPNKQTSKQTFRILFQLSNNTFFVRLLLFRVSVTMCWNGKTLSNSRSCSRPFGYGLRQTDYRMSMTKKTLTSSYTKTTGAAACSIH